MRGIAWLVAAGAALVGPAVAAPPLDSSEYTPNFGLEKRTAAYAGAAYGCWCNDVCKKPFRKFEPIGCFDMRTGAKTILDLSATWVAAKTLTHQTCHAACKGMGFRYAAIGWNGQQCHCGNKINGDQTDSDLCSSSCKGDGMAENCGGPNVYTIFQDSTFPKIQDVSDATLSGYVPVGCYQDDAQHVLKYQAETSDAMNVERCKSRCAERGYPYAGVTWKKQCE
ncbi:hypothetical protein H072_4641 [Dactylellina haptotyla CBS 200.50]|uniref:WSC domain-containing protein n=1 Tax=Dactylellina haptotyla (strain CBS 200.50) TaxID=1284197 RepID=S8AK14_DACHA|nr:hypothetical protein H072_4641 [Dactylellina haptotyla CBS 200.50]